MKKYLESKESDIASFDKWFIHCRSKQIPYVVIKKKKKYATVEWDYISYDTRYDVIFGKEDDTFIESVKKIFLKYTNQKSIADFSNHVVTYENILIEKSQKMAEELYDLVSLKVIKEERISN